MRSEVLLALIKTEVEDSLESSFPSGRRGPRGLKGPEGPPGRNGNDFDVQANIALIKNLIAENALKFKDLSEEEIQSLTGPKGDRGPRGREGRAFVFADHEEQIDNLIREEVELLKPSLKLTFEELSEEERASLKGERGPRGQKGSKGRDFDFEEYREYFDSLRLKFSDLTLEEVDDLKLKFENLTEQERDSLSLKFSDLDDSEIAKIRGPRGQRGKAGRTGDIGDIGPQGAIGDRGDRGLQGLPGLPGIIGKTGPQGFAGPAGEDAPIITEIKVKKEKDRFKFEFLFDNGSSLNTDWVNIPERTNHYVVGGGVVSGSGGSGGGSGEDGEDAPVVTSIETERVDDTIRFVFTFDDASTIATDYVDLVEGPQGPAGADGDASISNRTMACEPEVYVGAAVYIKKENILESNLDEWDSLSSIKIISYSTYDEVLALALADNISTSRVIGIVDSKNSSESCELRLIGITSEIFLGLDVYTDYYLSDSSAGDLVPEHLKPTASGSVIVRLGQPVSDTEFVFDRGQLTEIS